MESNDNHESIFISYSNLDRRKMEIFEGLINERNFKSIVILKQRKNMETNTEKVSKGIDDCQYFVPLITRNSINTQWINQEIGYAKAKNKDIFPIIENNIVKIFKRIYNE